VIDLKKNGMRNSSNKKEFNNEAGEEFLINQKDVDMRVINDIKKDSKPDEPTE